ncbi:bifunctional sulfur transferase/dioxygenase Blh [Acuticoccus sp. MNP-M23]|uniref:bifunctional sulfur transferase/dioxygenase Blh n=1 Tax=Acuticoccus sp. MNP-M23 TaxID=3072793 RepID=UPI0028164B17|nr:bifunctional sulfur transferase/dioxygenase Blh [Acuticoccus sp. MNP-M23]WMS42717.1 bifunctional sulfur transferase/dioxygenase Blh [Acuticoccus sp. MNP-M23]
MRTIPINDRLAVAAQPAIAEIAGLKAAGFAAIINSRPDGESAEQPGNAAEAEAADDAGLGYAFVPVRPDEITEADVRAFQSAMAAADGKVLAHCASGMRALILHTIGEVLDGRMDRGDIAAFGARHGFDLSAAERWLTRHAAAVPRVRGFFDPRTFSIQYVVSDPETRRCAIIDPVLDYDEKSGSVGTMNADAILAYIAEEGLSVEWILDTHPHADHFSAASYLKGKTGAPIAIGERVTDVQAVWSDLYNMPGLASGGADWDRLFADGETFRIGSMEASVLFSPGHTLASVTYLVGDAAFVHDTLFMPDSGSARADFPGGSAQALWHSINRILALPPETRLFTGHDYQERGRHPRWESTVAAQRARNAHVAGIDEAAYTALRNDRDKTLPMPRLILSALQVNTRGGRLPEPEDNGRRYLKIPLDALEGARW